jgi:hypothetical protein
VVGNNTEAESTLTVKADGKLTELKLVEEGVHLDPMVRKFIANTEGEL